MRSRRGFFRLLGAALLAPAAAAAAICRTRRPHERPESVTVHFEREAEVRFGTAGSNVMTSEVTPEQMRKDMDEMLAAWSRATPDQVAWVLGVDGPS